VSRKSPYLLYEDGATAKDYCNRRYNAKDPEGHVWSFATPLDG
jgi:hypothetical protein